MQSTSVSGTQDRHPFNAVEEPFVIQGFIFLRPCASRVEPRTGLQLVMVSEWGFGRGLVLDSWEQSSFSFPSPRFLTFSFPWQKGRTGRSLSTESEAGGETACCSPFPPCWGLGAVGQLTSPPFQSASLP